MGSSYIDPGHFFGELVNAAPHERAIAMIVAGEIDGAAIDSTVLERQQIIDPKSVEHLRIVKSLGSNPAPPLVINRSLDPYLRTRHQQAMLAMHFDPADG
jgi:ABC-type phosphate/phosphonate transport system substrate-binding protein